MSIETIDPERLARLMDPANHLRQGTGLGVNGAFDTCALQAVHWLAGGDGSSDEPECVAPTITRYVIRLNDAVSFKDWRDELKPYLPRLLNTVNPALEMRRAYLCVDWAVRWCAPLAFDAAADALTTKFPARAASLRAHAATMRALPEVTDAASAQNAADDAYAAYAAYAANAANAYAANAANAYAAYAANAANAAANAAAYAADAAYAANAADAAAYAADAAAAAAYAAAYAADAAETNRAIWDGALDLLDRLIRVEVEATR